MIDVICNAALLLGCSFQRCVGRDARHEMLAQIGSEVGEAFIAKNLGCAQNRGRVDVIAFGDLAR